jgi:hypothetical protein
VGLLTRRQTNNILQRHIKPGTVGIFSSFKLHLSFFQIHTSYKLYTPSYNTNITTMSNDSISSISSGPVPTTPTEIISIEMDRFGDVWARLNIDPKNPILLQKKQPQMICENEMLPLPIEPDQPIWDHKQTVDTHVPGQPQTYFAQRYKDGKVVLQSEIHISTLKAALELAHRLVFGQVGRRLAGARKSEEAAAKVEELSTCNPWTFALELLPVEGRLTGFHQDRPRNLFLNFTVSLSPILSNRFLS